MMNQFNGVNTSYRISGTGDAVILLHGWGQNMQMMSEIEKHLQSSYCVYNLDFPGFGESDSPNVAWSVMDYVVFLEDFVQKNEIQDPILIGHSFGCRVAIRYAARNSVKKMILTGAAGLLPKRGVEYYLKTNIYKIGKNILKLTGNQKKLAELQARSGSEDYRNASGTMKATFVKVVNDNVASVLEEVTCPVLLVFGSEDTATPVWMGKYMEAHMKNAGLAIIEGDDHFAYWHQPERFNRIVDIFFNSRG